MSGDLEIDLVGLLPFKRKLDRLSGKKTRALLDRVGFAVENQTRKRITDDKRAPDGKRWRGWSEGYAASGRARALLERSGGLRDSITYQVRGDAVIVGSNLRYARRHQVGDAGGKGIPARPYLGLSRANTRQIVKLVARWIEREVAR